VLVSGTTVINTCRREYSLTVDAIIKQLLSPDKVSLALDGWTLTNKVTITSVIAYNMNQNWALRALELPFNEDVSVFISFFEM